VRRSRDRLRKGWGYRAAVPIAAYENGFPALLGDGVVSHDDAKAVLGFYGTVGDINRGLKQVNAAMPDGVKTDHSVRLSMRLDTKCKDLVKAGGLYDAGKNIHRST